MEMIFIYLYTQILMQVNDRISEKVLWIIVLTNIM